MAANQRVSGQPLSCALVLLLALNGIRGTGGDATAALDVEAFSRFLATFSNDILGAQRMQVINEAVNITGVRR